MDLVSLCLSDRIRYSPWFITDQRDRPHSAAWCLFICRAVHTLACVFLCGGFRVYARARALVSAGEKVWESPLPSLLFVGCWAVCSKGSGPHDKTGWRVSWESLCFNSKSCALLSALCLPAAICLWEGQFKVCYVTHEVGDVRITRDKNIINNVNIRAEWVLYLFHSERADKYDQLFVSVSCDGVIHSRKTQCYQNQNLISQCWNCTIP